MEFWDVIKKRKSIRSFWIGQEISDEKINKIIEAGKRAPSAGGIYPTEFIIIKDYNIREALSEMAFNQRSLTQASVVIAVVADTEKNVARYGDRGRNLYSIQDAAAATQNMLLAIVDMGLASCWVGAFDEAKVREILGLPSNKRPLTLLPIGYEK